MLDRSPSARFTLATLTTLASLGSPATAQDWALRSFTTSPAGATFPRMAYDTQRARCVVFGGWNAPSGTIVFQETWEYDGAAWTLRAPATVPPERESHVMAYDSNRGKTVMFGGWDFNFNMLPGTWEWDGTDWTNTLPANAPGPRLLSAMTFDSGRNVIVLFGGSGVGGRVADTWEYDGTNWNQIATAAPPSARESHVMAYDSARARTVLFGGRDANGLLGDTWEYDGANWTQIMPDGAPSPRVDAALVFDVQRARCVLFGGADNVFDLDETWEYDGGGWRELFTANRPQGNSALAMAYDRSRGQAVVFGGFDGAAAIADTFELGGNAATYRTFGTGCDGSNNLPPRLVPNAMPTLGSTTAVAIVDLPAVGGAVFVTAGFSATIWNGMALPFDLGGFGLTGCRAYTSADAALLVTHGGSTANWSLALPSTPTLSGLVLFLQALSIDPAVARPVPAAASNAAEMNVR
ncbi:MAG: hypothetical protein KDE27_12640 [Planctomycetes bacterium]|nr:hypothetical protein [Planctomycetota bacterium]